LKELQETDESRTAESAAERPNPTAEKPNTAAEPPNPAAERPKTKVKRLGDRLIEAGAITRKQLETALREQKRLKEPLGRILVDLGFVEPGTLSRTIASEWEVEYVNLKDVEIDLELIENLDEAFAAEHLFVPIRREKDNRITVAMTDPTNIFGIDTIQNYLGTNINILAASHEDVLRTISRLFAGEEDEVESGAGGDDAGDQSYSVMEKVDEIINKALSRQATDIHVEPEEKLLRIRYRMDGILQPGDILPADMTSAVVTRFKIVAGMNITERRRPQDGRFSKQKGNVAVDFRVSTMPTAYGENIVIRLLDRSSVSLNMDFLGIEGEQREKISKLANQSHGMFLVSGPTGSGKTTTLYAMILTIDAVTRKVVTVEDPIEYRLPFIRQSQVDGEIGYSFADGLRTILRQDPDVILIGEIRDPETAAIAVKSSMTGHMLFSSIHTNSAMGAVQRLSDMGVERYLIPSNLSGVLGQRLVRRICPKCKTEYKADRSEIAFLGVDDAVTLHKGAGCASCHETGYAGRTIIFELFFMDNDFADLVMENKSEKEFVALAREKGVSSIVDCGREKVLKGITTIAEVMRVCNDIEH